MDSKFNNNDDYEMVLMLRYHCIPQSLHDYIKRLDNFEKLCSGNNYFKEADLIIKGFVFIAKNYDELHRLINIFIQCYFRSFTFTVKGLVCKIRSSLLYITKIKKKPTTSSCYTRCSNSRF